MCHAVSMASARARCLADRFLGILHIASSSLRRCLIGRLVCSEMKLAPWAQPVPTRRSPACGHTADIAVITSRMCTGADAGRVVSGQFAGDAEMPFPLGTDISRQRLALQISVAQLRRSTSRERARTRDSSNLVSISDVANGCAWRQERVHVNIN